jgi:ribosomal protein S2
MKRTLSAAIAVAFLVTPAFAGRINNRRENQQDRIAQGVASGRLTPRETVRLERNEVRLHGEIADMREDNGGKLTKKDRVIVNRQQNKLSRQIYKLKHDGQK